MQGSVGRNQMGSPDTAARAAVVVAPPPTHTQLCDAVAACMLVECPPLAPVLCGTAHTNVGRLAPAVLHLPTLLLLLLHLMECCLHAQSDALVPLQEEPVPEALLRLLCQWHLLWRLRMPGLQKHGE